jgi:hypothetical protein
MYRAKVVNYSQVEGKVVYHVLVKHVDSGKAREVSKRYSEFRALHATLADLVARFKLMIELPPFPARKVVGKTNSSEDTINMRRA